MKNTAEDYLKAAIDTAEWIDTLAIKTVYGRIWQALPEGQDGYREDVPLFTPKKHSWGFWNCQCQCCGTAGILEHFAAMYEYTGEKEFYDYMLRTYAALTGKKLTNLYEYHFFEKF